ncbi:MAG: valine--tRNA ligase [Proteobacteria bacterium]|nr:valine--tRNA ligase [Pseudomonadota bacterium]
MLDKTYDPTAVEQRLYKQWEESGVFEPNGNHNAQPLAIMMPPPNVTGTLHLGHALDNTLPDMLVRRARMMGKDAFYQPGTDHAGIATQMVVERELAKQGLNRRDMGREKFLEKVWEWKAYSGGSITGQMRRLGVSCAWQRERFTMDDGLSKAVRKVFVELYKKGLIYRGKRLVNWDTVLETAVSDLEVKHKELKGHLWHIRYPLAEGEGHVVVATTRPETLLGDMAVAVHPDDARYKKLHGKQVKLPLTNRTIPVICDEYVDPEFGSGVVKITPAHDFNDFEVGKRHGLEMLNVLTTDGKINDHGGSYKGLDRFVARKQMVKDLEAQGLIEKIEDHINNVGHGERGGQPIEPFLTEQWYVQAQPLADKVLQAVDQEKVTFVPERQKKIALNWLNNIQDWCISRQLWWGHQIPAWYCADCGEVTVEMDDPSSCAHCGSSHIKRDDDVLDTWFSSALWPFSTLGWPDKTPELTKYYPTHAIMPGVDILFFWVIRMMMMGLEFMGEVPFKTIYLHALILDEHGQKMSKSKGNTVDPLTVIDQFGADALRFTLAIQAAPGQDMRISDTRLENSRNFLTKIWNAARYAEMNEAKYDAKFNPSVAKHPVNLWVMGELAKTLADMDKAYEEFRFNDVAQSMYQFTWNTYCDWYLELSKPLVYGDDEALKAETKAVMGYVFEKLLRVLHPAIPFVTEELWQSHTDADTGEGLIAQAWPTAEDLPTDSAAMAEMNWLIKVVSAIRAARAENRVPPKEEIAVKVRGGSDADKALFAKLGGMITFLTKTNGFVPTTDEPSKTDVVAVAEGLEIILPLAGIVDFEAEKKRIEKEIAKFEAELNKLEGMLGNPGFMARAPEHVVAEQKARKEVILQDLEKLRAVYDARS